MPGFTGTSVTVGVDAADRSATRTSSSALRLFSKALPPGTWGQEVRLGTGQVDRKGFFRALDAAGFKGDLCIEREVGTQRAADIRAARE